MFLATVCVVVFFKIMYNKTVIIRVGFCDIRNNQGLEKCYQPRLITLTSTLTIPDATKTLIYNDCLFQYILISLTVTYNIKTTKKLIHNMTQQWRKRFVPSQYPIPLRPTPPPPKKNNSLCLLRWKGGQINSGLIVFFVFRSLMVCLVLNVLSSLISSLSRMG